MCFNHCWVERDPVRWWSPLFSHQGGICGLFLAHHQPYCNYHCSCSVSGYVSNFINNSVLDAIGCFTGYWSNSVATFSCSCASVNPWDRTDLRHCWFPLCVEVDYSETSTNEAVYTLILDSLDSWAVCFCCLLQSATQWGNGATVYMQFSFLMLSSCCSLFFTSDKLQISLSRPASFVRSNYSFDYPRRAKKTDEVSQSRALKPHCNACDKAVTEALHRHHKAFEWVRCHCHIAPQALMFFLQFCSCCKQLITVIKSCWSGIDQWLVGRIGQK